MDEGGFEKDSVIKMEERSKKHKNLEGKEDRVSEIEKKKKGAVDPEQSLMTVWLEMLEDMKNGGRPDTSILTTSDQLVKEFSFAVVGSPKLVTSLSCVGVQNFFC